MRALAWLLGVLCAGCIGTADDVVPEMESQAITGLAAVTSAEDLVAAYALAAGQEEVLDVWGGRALLGRPAPVAPNSDGPLQFELRQIRFVDRVSEPISGPVQDALFSADGVLVVRVDGSVVHITARSEVSIAAHASPGLTASADRRAFGFALGLSPDVAVARWALGADAPVVAAPGLSPVWAVTMDASGETIRFAHADSAGVSLWSVSQDSPPRQVRPLPHELVPVGRRAVAIDECMVYESPSGLVEACGADLRRLGEWSRPAVVDGGLMARPLPANRLSGLNAVDPIEPVEVPR
jgi:hypothetical protein